MKTLFVTVAMGIMAANAGASEVYRGFEQGNPDLSTQHVSARDFVGVQPSIGDRIERYHGLAEGNPDLFKTAEIRTTSSNDPQVYHGFSGNPDLSY